MSQAVASEAPLEVLSPGACLDLLGTAGVGRVVVSVGDLPVVFLVGMAVDRESVVFPVRRGSELAAAVAGGVIALEADLLDRLSGWSIVATGRARALPEGSSSPPGPWPAGSHLFRLPLEHISGRRLATEPIHVAGSVRPATAAAVNREAAPPCPLGYRSEVEPITCAESFALLATEEVGRLAAVVDGQPFIFPVNYALDRDTVLFRTAGGTKLTAVSQSLVTFEVDRCVPADNSGWTVSVEGIATVVADDSGNAAMRARMGMLPLVPWAPGDHPYLVRVMPVSVRGSRWSPRR